ncbi:ankyrin repeat domain-containing protein 20B-like isoform X2 [Falco biarmicus]|uniref:ankyrin repeat domain-containing protein 20B-like isoform X2 n=1 Tax=Falco biarmicus TaxID=345155 RepID=UPI0024BC9391|nr:ankyrin repeat domain-containing protein 20B-like isoform X2 [Falco biarmicus]XP_056182172.1 ankyrin repeat domain-containing protein 20B-like isoform X2 [Falco biarmicus]
MKRFFGFWRKKKGQPAASGSAAKPFPTGAYELRLQELGKLHRAAARGDLGQVRQRLKKCGIDERDTAERTPLHLASANGHVNVVTYLIENKCKLNLTDSDNRSPLMKAVQCQQEECVAILLEHGANPHLADADGNTALHLAVRSPNTTVAGLLLEHNANIDARNKEGNTPLILAISERHEDIAEFLLQRGADVHARDHCERTPLMTAASGGQLNLIKALLRYGADLFHKDSNGWTAEDYAVTHGYSSLCTQLVAYAFWGDRDEGGAQGDTVPGIPHRARAAGLTLGAPAVDRGGMPQSPSQTSRTGKPKKATDDLSQGDSIGLEKEGSDVSWRASEEELDFSPKKLQKPNLTFLMNVSQQFRKNTGKKPMLESQRPNSVFLEHVDDEDTEEEQCEVDNKVCEALKQGSEHLCLNRHEENVRAAFHSSTKEKSPEREEEEKEQEKENTGEELRTAVVEGVKNSICNDSHQVHSASKDDTGERSALTAVGAEEEEDAESPWDSETDSESPEEGSPGVLLPAADRHGARSRIVSGERHTGNFVVD